MGKNRVKYQIFHINIIIFSSKHLRNQIQFFQKKILASYFVKANATESHGNDLYLFQQGFVYLCITSIFSLKTLIFFDFHTIFITFFFSFQKSQFQTKYFIVHTLFLRFWLLKKYHFDNF